MTAKDGDRNHTVIWRHEDADQVLLSLEPVHIHGRRLGYSYRRSSSSWSYNPAAAAGMWGELQTSLLSYAAAAICLFLLRNWIAGGVCNSKVHLSGKTVLITGANTGIGKETARDMARRGARVVMACRDLIRAERAANEIRRSTGNCNVVVRQLDLASLYSIREFAKEYKATEERLDILINNAGVMMCPKWLTEDGYETQLAVNHLGHFLLTNLLLGKLKSSAPSRVVNVSSMAHKGGKIHFDDLCFEKTPYNPLVSYRQSKLASVLFSKELAHRTKGTGVSSFSLHPGIIRTELSRHVERRNLLLKVLLPIPCMLLMKTPWQGAQTSIYCAVTEGLEDKSGCYFRNPQTVHVFAPFPKMCTACQGAFWGIPEDWVRKHCST